MKLFLHSNVYIICIHPVNCRQSDDKGGKGVKEIPIFTTASLSTRFDISFISTNNTQRYSSANFSDLTLNLVFKTPSNCMRKHSLWATSSFMENTITCEYRTRRVLHWSATPPPTNRLYYKWVLSFSQVAEALHQQEETYLVHIITECPWSLKHSILTIWHANWLKGNRILSPIK